MATEAIGGMEPTGRTVTAPAAEVVEVVSSKGLKHLAYVHADTFVGHPAVSSELQIGWMEDPDVSGLARLVHHDPDTATFVYATGTCFTLAEVVRVFADEGEGAGVKAGLELCYLVGEALADASESGGAQGVLSHGNINPWTVVLRPDGQPVVVGYGLPQVEILAWLDDARQVPREDSFRYAPPERLDGEEEDIASDLFALALVGLELIMGRPVYDGLLDDIRQQASRGEGMRRLYQWRDKLPANVREVLGRALKPDPDTRFRSGLDFVYAVHDLLGSIDVEGPSLVEVMGRVRAVTKRGRAPIEGGKTGTLSKAELAELAADLVDYDERDLPPPKKPRPDPEPEEPEETDEAEAEAADAPRFASRVGRGRQPDPEPEPEPDPRASVRERLRSRRRPSENETSVQEPSARERLLRRLKEGREDTSAGRRRLRRTVGEDEPPAPRRRTRRESPSAASQSIDIGDPLGFDANQSQFSLEEEVDEPDPPSEPEPKPRTSRRRRPPRTDDLAPQPIEGPVPDPPEDEAATTVEPSPLRASGGAAALLERLRSSSGGRRERRERRSRKKPTPTAAPVSEPAPVEPVRSEPVSEVAPPPRRRAPPAELPSNRDVPPAPVPEPAPSSPPPAETEPPETTHWEGGDESGPWLVMGPRGSTAVERAEVATVAALVARAVLAQGLVDMDATGQLLGWWGARQSGKTLVGDQSTAALPPAPVELVPLAAAVARARVRAGTGAPVERLVATTVPVGWLAASLGRVLGLQGELVVQVGGRALDPWEVLSGVDLDEHELVLTSP